jgi:PAS domain S-box-containing protein
MAKYNVEPTNREVFFGEEEIIVSKTDLKGRITYANDIFLNVAGFTEAEVLGQPHSLVRHPTMPRSVFKFLWDTIEAKTEIFAYVKNMAKNGDHYWVLAHVTPSLDANGAITGYHSNRRVPDRSALAKIEPIYAALLAEEKRHSNAKDGMNAGLAMLVDTVKQTGMSYEEFIFTV